MFIDDVPEDQEHQRISPAKKEYLKFIMKHPKDLLEKQVVRLASQSQVSIAF